MDAWFPLANQNEILGSKTSEFLDGIVHFAAIFPAI
jgi:hypothetical protein